MSGRGTADAVVIGAGIIGAACAAALARRGLRVLVLDADIAGGGATAAGMGHIVAMDDSPAQLALTRYSRELWRNSAAASQPAVETTWCGTIWLAEDDAQLEAARQRGDACARRGIGASLLSERELYELEPHLRQGLAGGLLISGDGVLYPPAATLALLEEARALGAKVREGVSVSRIGDHEVWCDGEDIRAAVVINAAGAAAARLTPGLPIVPRKGHLLVTDRHPGLCRHQLVELGYLHSAHEMSAESVAFNLQPRPRGQLLIGSSRELVGWDRSINRRVVRRMVERARGFLPALDSASVIRAWTGFRPATPDGLPFIGSWDPTPGLWIAAGHEGLGITTASGTAELLADQLTGCPPAIDPAPYSPLRALATANHG